tara:strand:- start:1042 stop:1911 length:870 start_codon:yes stop_codon:yes gene_type:complete
MRNMKIFSLFRRKFKIIKTFVLIEAEEDLEKFTDELSEDKVFGVDTEFDWRTTYFPKLSLLQISTSKKIFLIDCLKLDIENVLKDFFESDDFLKVFHSARSDINVINKCLNIDTRNVFDIQIAESLLNGNNIKSYAKIVYKYFGIVLEKSETNSNWLKRPLTCNQIIYAKDDVDFLIEIYKLQRKILSKKNLVDSAFKMSSKEAILGNESLKILRLRKNRNSFSNRAKLIFSWREDIAISDNIPPAYIFKDKYLLKLSKISSSDNTAKKKVKSIIGDSMISDKFIRDFL